MAPRSYEKVGQELPEDVVAVVGALEIETPLSDAEQKAVLRKVALRILPICWFTALLAYLDRANLSLAKLQMDCDLNVEAMNHCGYSPTAPFGSRWTPPPATPPRPPPTSPAGRGLLQAVAPSIAPSVAPSCDPLPLCPNMFTETVYGFGSGIFFWTYTMLAVPSNMLMPRFGAVTWLSCIIASWGVVASAGVFLQGPKGFYALRLALGISEAGFYPGMSYYLTSWFEGDEFGEAYAFVTLGSCCSGILGGPLAIAILSMDGMAGLPGWRWLFLLEGVPAAVLGLCYRRILPANPASALFLTDREKAWVISRNAARKEAAALALAAKEAKAGRGGAAAAEGDGPTKTATQKMLEAAKLAASCWRVWYLAVIHFFGLMAYYGILFWLPTLVKQILATASSSCDAQLAGGAARLPDYSVIGISIIPYIFASLGLVFNAKHSLKTKEQRWHAVLPMALGAIGLGITFPLKTRADARSQAAIANAIAGGATKAAAAQAGAKAGAPFIAGALIAITVGVFGSWAEHGPMASLWEDAAAELGHDAQGVAFAIINSVANFGGFVGPYLMGVESSPCTDLTCQMCTTHMSGFCKQLTGDCPGSWIKPATNYGAQARGTLMLAYALFAAVIMTTFYPMPKRSAPLHDSQLEAMALAAAEE